jgi:hypothetical protein
MSGPGETSARKVSARRHVEQRVGRERYRWMSGLGNESVRTGTGRMRLVCPEQALELLGLVLSAEKQSSRVVFFCSCESPLAANSCHRRLVGRELVAAAQHLQVPLRVEEWPGGKPTRRTIRISVPRASIDALLGGAVGVPVPRNTALRYAALPHGQVIQFHDGERRYLAACSPPVYHARRWAFPLFVTPADRSSAPRMTKTSLEERRRLGL